MSERTGRPAIKYLILHGLHKIKHIEIALDQFTTISGRKLPPEVFEAFIIGLKFILSQNETVLLGDIQFMCAESSSAEYLDEGYVEAHIAKEDNTLMFFKKSFKNEEVLYEINGAVVSKDFFNQQFTGLELGLHNTLYIDSQMIARLAIMDEISRTKFLEKYCEHPELLSKYSDLITKNENLKVELSSINTRQKELKQQEKLEKSKLKNAGKLKKLFQDQQNQTETYLLFKLYHNEQTRSEQNFETADQLQTDLDEMNANMNSCADEYMQKVWEHNEGNVEIAEASKSLLESFDNYCNSHDDTVILNHKSARIESYLASDERNSLLESISMRVEKINSEIAILKLMQEQMKESEEDYRKLSRNFYNENLQSVITQKTLEKLLMDERAPIISFAKLESFFSNDKMKLERQMTTLKESLKSHEVAITESTARLSKLKAESNKKNQQVIKLEEMLLIQRNNKKDDGQLVEKLRHKFPNRVHGRLPEFFDVNPANGISVKKHHILTRLGKHADAIIVDDTETIEKCKNFLHIHEYYYTEVTFIALDAFLETQSTQSVLRNKRQLPGNLKAEPIENFLKTSCARVKNAIMYFLKPTLVCESLENVQIIFNRVEKALQVTSFGAKITYKPNGFRVTHPDEKFLIHDEVKAYEKIQNCKVELMQLDADMRSEQVFLTIKEENKRDVQENIQLIESFLQANAQFHERNQKVFAKETDVLKELSEINGFNELNAKYNEIKNKLQAKKAEHYRHFCEIYKFPTIDDYEERVRKVLPDRFEKICNALTYISELYESSKSRLEPSGDVEKILKLVEEQLRVAKNRFNEMERELELAKEKHKETNEKMKKSLESVVKEKERYWKCADEILTRVKEFCDKSNGVRISLLENFELLNEALLKNNSVPFRNGSLVKILEFPDVNEEDFDLIEHVINSIEIDYDKLGESLKRNDNVNENAQKLKEKLHETEESLSKFSVDVEGDERALQRIIRKLNELVKEGTKIKNNIQSLTNELDEVRSERVRRFNECLQIVNKEIENFCQHAMNGRVKAELKALDDREPYLNGVQYSWTTELAPHNLVTDLNKNYHAAFALLMGILKYRKQQFVMMNDVRKVIAEDKSLIDYFKNNSGLQILYFTSSVKPENSTHHFSLMERDDSFILLKL